MKHLAIWEQPSIFVRIPKATGILDLFPKLGLAKADLGLDPAVYRNFDARNTVLLIDQDFIGGHRTNTLNQQQSGFLKITCYFLVNHSALEHWGNGLAVFFRGMNRAVLFERREMMETDDTEY